VGRENMNKDRPGEMRKWLVKRFYEETLGFGANAREFVVDPSNVSLPIATS
jgi:hypothetical protein